MPFTVALPVVCPAGIVIVGVASVAIVGSLLDSVITRPPAGAAGLIVIDSGALPPGCTVTGPPSAIIPVAAPAVIVTDDGALSTCVSLQVNCTV